MGLNIVYMGHQQRIQQEDLLRLMDEIGNIIRTLTISQYEKR
jgi:hypothetical protein